MTGILELHREGLCLSDFLDAGCAPAVRVGPLLGGAVPPQQFIPQELEDVLLRQHLGQEPDVLVEPWFVLQVWPHQPVGFAIPYNPVTSGVLPESESTILPRWFLFIVAGVWLIRQYLFSHYEEVV